MPRPVKMRVSYGPDAAYLLRLEDAVGKDGRRSDAWRKKVLRHLHAAATLFLQADAQGMGMESVEPKRKRSRRAATGSDTLNA